MEKGAVFRALMWSLVAFFAWVFVSRLIWPLPPQSQVATTQPAEGADGSAVEGGQETTSAPAGSAVSPASTMPATPKYTARGGDTPQSITLGDVTAQQDSPFRMQVQLTSSGASVSNVMLADFAKDVDKPDRYPLLSPVSAEGDRTLTSLPIEKVTIDGQETWLRDVIWAVADAADVPQGASAARFVVDIVNGSDQPVLSLAYDYVLPQQALADQRYDLNTSLTLQNRDQVPHTVVVTMAGPVGIHKEDPRTDYRAVTAAAGEPGEVEAHTANYRDLNRHSEKTIHAVGDEEPLIWAAVDNKFFSCTLAPVGADGRQVGDYVAEARAVDLDGDGETTDDRTFQLVSKVCIMPAGTSETIRLACYLGPKDRHIFRDEDKNPDYVRRNYSLQITRMYTWCTFSWLAELMIALLTALHRVVFNYGVAIIILVLIVRTLLHPITKKGQVNMMKMQKQMGKLTPKMEELKKKYANDKAKLNQEMQNLYRSEGINPAGQMLTCLPMMIQMPIWVALWTSLNNNIAMRHEPFVLWIRDLTSPDGLIHFGGCGVPCSAAGQHDRAGDGVEHRAPSAGRDHVRAAETDAQAQAAGADFLPVGPGGHDAEDDAGDERLLRPDPVQRPQRPDAVHHGQHPVRDDRADSHPQAHQGVGGRGGG